MKLGHFCGFWAHRSTTGPGHCPHWIRWPSRYPFVHWLVQFTYVTTWSPGPDPNLGCGVNAICDPGVSLYCQAPVVEFNCSTFTKSILKNQQKICAYLYCKADKSSTRVTERDWVYSERWVSSRSTESSFLSCGTTQSGGKWPGKGKVSGGEVVILFWVKILRA